MTDKYRGKVTLYGKPCIYIHNQRFSAQMVAQKIDLDLEWIEANVVIVDIKERVF